MENKEKAQTILSLNTCIQGRDLEDIPMIRVVYGHLALRSPSNREDAINPGHIFP